jgi:hypothetical protein
MTSLRLPILMTTGTMASMTFLQKKKSVLLNIEGLDNEN